MPYAPFYDLFPEVAKAETRNLIAFEDPLLPPDQYVLMELYCNEIGCDCRRVFFNVYSEAKKVFVAVIAYGWESREFYKKWMHGDDDPLVINDLMGPVLNLGSYQSELAPALLARITEVLRDKEYVQRLKRHYRLYKDRINSSPERTEAPERRTRPKVGRNEPCPCGSGLKFKYCCGRA
jgi:SEC-C motif